MHVKEHSNQILDTEVAEGGERADAQADAGSVLERLVVQAEGGGIGESVEPNASR
jgi:hypothetical protein